MTQTQVESAVETKVPAQTYASILVHAEPAERSTRRVTVAARLARKFGARLIGLGAEAFEPAPATDPFLGYAAGEWITLVQEQIATDLKNAEAAFRRDAAGADVEWRSVQDFPARALARTARAADLIVVASRSTLGAMLEADPAEVIMTTGRPVLIVPEGTATLHADSIVIAWKDTREARRAIADAMPLLVRAKEVVVQAICEDRGVEAAVFQTEDVTASLKRHGVPARASVTAVSKDGVTHDLMRAASANNADLIVAGAYGHSRVREWAFGGVTADLLHQPPCFVLMSH